jgi:hypothetical protein
MHGVAFGAQIMPFKIIASPLDASWTTDTALAHAINRSYSNGALLNNHSWGLTYQNGSGVLIDDQNRNTIIGFYPDSTAAFVQSVSNGAVHVWAAGNDGEAQVGIHAGLPVLYSDLTRGWIAVAAVGTDGVIASYSNRCGVAAVWCIAAPGSVVNSVSN